jgi:hypothetical protein
VDQIIVEMARQAPGVAAIIFVVVQFLAHLRQITDDFRDEVREAREAIKENTRVMGRVDGALDAYDELHAKVSGFAQGQPPQQGHKGQKGGNP